MKLGILGTGMIVQDMLPMAQKLGFEEISILGTENSRQRTEELAKTYTLAHTYFDYDEMLHSDIDIFYVALPNHLHFAYSERAIDMGKHVIIEKPITSNTRELQELAGLAEEQDVMLFEAMSLYHLPAYQTLKDALAEIGPLKIANLNYSQYSSRYDAFQQGLTPPVFDWRKSGGSLMDINIYNIHGLVGLFGAPKRYQYFANMERGIDTSGVFLADYGDFQAVCIGAKDCTAPAFCTFQGEKGSIRVDGSLNGMTGYTVYLRDGTKETYRTEQPEHRMFYEFQVFLHCIREKDQAACQLLLKQSMMVAELLETARKQAGIRFESD